MKFFKLMRYRLMFLITRGKKRTHYKKKYKVFKGNALTEDRYSALNRWYLCNLMDHMQLYQKAAQLHPETFREYKNCNNGKTVALIGCGPTLNHFVPVKDAIYVGVNRAFRFDNVTLDYMFMDDYQNAGKIYVEESLNYKNKNLTRFYGIFPSWAAKGIVIPESVAIRHGAKRFYTRVRWEDDNHKFFFRSEQFAFDITAEPLTSSGSIVFPAMQFILYTNPKKVYIYGCDCNATGHFDESQCTADDPTWGATLNGWKLLKDFIDIYYPETEIISVNPIGLKGLFNDVYTVSYLEQNPHIDRNAVKILTSKGE